MASVTLDFESGHIGPDLEPDLDDLGRINIVTAARRNGSEYTDTDTDGPLGTTAIGDYHTRVDVNPDSDAALPQHAHYHLVLGTDPDPRYPSVSVDLTEQDAAFTSDVAAIDVGDLVALTSLPEDLGQPTADLLALGYTEVVGSHTRTIAFNTRQGGILTHVGMLDGNAQAGLQTAGAQLAGDITAEQVSFPVSTTSGPLFTTTPPTGAQIIVRDREIMTVSTVASVATDTFTRSVSNGWGTATSGQAWSVLSTTSNYSVDGTRGEMLVGATLSNRTALIDIGSLNAQAVVHVPVPILASGASYFANLFIRASTDFMNAYYARIEFNTTPSALMRMARFVSNASTLLGSAVSLGAYSVGQVWAIRFEVMGETLRAKAWNTSGSEPEDWQETVTDSTITSGTMLGFRAIANTGASIPYTQEWDNLEVINPQTFTVTRDPDQRMTHPEAGSVKVYRPLRLTL